MRIEMSLRLHIFIIKGICIPLIDANWCGGGDFFRDQEVGWKFPDEIHDRYERIPAYLN